MGTFPDMLRDTDWIAEFKQTASAYTVRVYAICVDR
jgi:hypothetical protein